ncbi:hypothetical protein HHK36_024787 [Tetracentron sinense]|uniref:Band 7 domain-containing protein n=1 Tax=Tetracentron sinense TaxID=13715 RepID=A0A834YQN3_TETSI|nr:hypothetical protein HHK36_024787 [Tetracentron sinense]
MLSTLHLGIEGDFDGAVIRANDWKMIYFGIFKLLPPLGCAKGPIQSFSNASIAGSLVGPRKMVAMKPEVHKLMDLDEIPECINLFWILISSPFILMRNQTMGQLLCCIQVDQSTIAIKENFGKFDDVLQPGCHFLPWCFGSQLAGNLSLRVQQLDVRCETKTKGLINYLSSQDNVFVTVVASIQYRALAEKAADAFYKLSNTKEQIQAYVFDVIRACVPKLDLDSTFEQKNKIAKAVEEELEKAMSAYGYEIVQTLIVDIEPDERVKKAMNEINAAARMRVAASEKAEAEKILQIKRAEGDAESKYLAGLGMARQRQAIVDGLRDSVLAFSANVPGTTAKDVMDMVLVTQYFDTIKEIGASSKSSSVFIPHGPGAVKDIASQIRDGLLQANITHQ